MKKLLILTLSIFVLTLASCGGGGGGSASPAIPQSTSPSAEFTPRSLSSSEVAELGEIVSTNQKSDETLQKLKEALEVIAGRTLSADEVNTFYQFITAILSSTTPPPTSDECEAGRILNAAGNACRLLNSTDCTAKGRILNDEGNACRPLTIADCEAESKILQHNSCVTPEVSAPTDAECRNLNQRLNDDATACRPLTIADCQTGQIINEAGNACRPLTNTDCDAKGQVLKDSGDSCRLLTSADCTAKGQILNAAGKSCRPLTNADCEAESKILQHNSCVTPAPTDAECRSQNQRLNAAGSACRPLTNADCQAESKILQHNSCVVPEVSAPTDAECRSQNQRLNEAGSACRPLTNADCTDGKVLNTAGNACATPDPVEPEPPVEACGYYESVRDTVTGQCRPAKLEDCQAIGQVLYEGDNGTCRPITNADCETGQTLSVTDNTCVAETVETPDPVEPDPAPEPPVTCGVGKVPTDNGNTCRPLTNADCQISDQFINDAGTACRDILFVPCEGGVMVGSRVGYACEVDLIVEVCMLVKEAVNDAGDGCRPFTATECQAKGRTLRGDSCISNVESECLNRKMIFRNGVCADPTNDRQCKFANGNDKFVLFRGVCKILTNADCQADGKVLNSEWNYCRPLTNVDCEAKSQVLNDAGNACRAPTDTEAAALEYKRLYQFRNSIPIEVVKVTDGTTVTTIVESDRNGKRVAERIEIQVSILFAIHGRTITRNEDGTFPTIWYTVQDEATAKHREILLNRTRCPYQAFSACGGNFFPIVTIAATTFTVNGKTCNIDAYSTDGLDSTKAVVAYWFENSAARAWLDPKGRKNNVYFLKNVDNDCVRHFNGETAPLAPADLPDVRFQQPGDYFRWLAKAYPNGFLPFANVDYASGYYHYGIQYGTTIEDMNFGFRATDKGAYNAMFYKSLNAGNHAFFSYDKSEDSLMVLGLDTDTDFYGKGKVRFTVSSNIINPEKKFGIGYSTNIHNSEFVGVLEYRQDSAVNVGFKLNYDL